MSIEGIGADIVKTSRFKKIDKKHKQYWQKFFSGRELAYCFSYQQPARHLAGIFAAKEAVVKALHSKKIDISQIEISHNKKGVPQAIFRDKKILITISHAEAYAVAVAISIN